MAPNDQHNLPGKEFRANQKVNKAHVQQGEREESY